MSNLIYTLSWIKKHIKENEVDLTVALLSPALRLPMLHSGYPLPQEPQLAPLLHRGWCLLRFACSQSPRRCP